MNRDMNNEQLKEGQHVTCAVRCSFTNGEIVSDRPNFEFVIGSGKCLPAFEEAVKALNLTDSNIGTALTMLGVGLSPEFVFGFNFIPEIIDASRKVKKSKFVKK